MAPVAELEQAQRLDKDIKKAAATLSDTEARYLVDSYYIMQRDRIRASNQVRALTESKEPHTTIAWLSNNSELLERNIKSALDVYSDAHVVGKWSKSIVGIGPVIAAGLLGHINMEPWRCLREDKKKKDDVCEDGSPCTPACGRGKLNTVGQIWRFAGLDPTVRWEAGKKRPWNESLKTLTWKIGESFVKFSGHDEDFYGRFYIIRKKQEIERNLAGLLSDQATEMLTRFKFNRETDAKIWYEGRLTVDAAQTILNSQAEKRMGLAKKLAGDVGSGTPMLPPAHIHSRSKRWAVKLFLSHWHAVAFRAHFGTDAPKPYVLTHLEGHNDEVVCPNWPF